MAAGSELPLTQQFLLVAVAVTRGRIARWRTEIGCALGGALLLELVRGGQLTVTYTELKLRTADRHCDPAADEALGRLLLAERSRTPAEWITRLAPGAMEGTWERLVVTGALAPSTVKWLGVLPVTSWHAADGRWTGSETARLSALLHSGPRTKETESTGRTVELAALLYAARMEHLLGPGASRPGARAAIRDAHAQCADGPPVPQPGVFTVVAAVERSIESFTRALALPG